MNFRRGLSALFPRSLKRFIKGCIYNLKGKFRSTEYPICAFPNERYPIIYKIKETTWEPVSMGQVWGVSKGTEVAYRHEEQNILLLKNAKVSNNSEIIIADNSVIWDKYYFAGFSAWIPKDENLFSYNRDNVVVFNYPVESISGDCISLSGWGASIWAHFLPKIFSKFYYAERAGILKDGVTVLLNPTMDYNINEIYEMWKNQYPKLNWIDMKKDTYYKCESLYYIPAACHLSDEEMYMHPINILYPQQMLSTVKANLAEPLINRVKNRDAKFAKIFLVRRTWRTLTNWKEVEDWFQEQGFYMLEGSVLTLEEKADLFYHAKEIVGPYSSAWTNTMFCKGAKGLMFSNVPCIIDSSEIVYSYMGNMQVMQVIGDEVRPISRHEDFYIPLDKIKEAYYALINNLNLPNK